MTLRRAQPHCRGAPIGQEAAKIGRAQKALFTDAYGTCDLPRTKLHAFARIFGNTVTLTTNTEPIHN